MKKETKLEKKRVSLFIDGSNLYHSLKYYKINIKFQDIIKILSEEMEVLDIFYYTAKLEKSYDEERFLKHEKFLYKIRQIPNFHIVLCNLRKTILKNGTIVYNIKGDDVYLATDLIKGAYEDLYDLAIIVSGDEDFIPAINTVRKIGKQVINAFFPKSSSYLLRNSCDKSINLKKTLIKNRSPNMA